MFISSSWSSYITPDPIPPKDYTQTPTKKAKQKKHEITHTPITASNAVSPEQKKNSELQIKFMNAYSIKLL